MNFWKILIFARHGLMTKYSISVLGRAKRAENFEKKKIHHFLIMFCKFMLSHYSFSLFFFKIIYIVCLSLKGDPCPSISATVELEPSSIWLVKSVLACVERVAFLYFKNNFLQVTFYSFSGDFENFLLWFTVILKIYWKIYFIQNNNYNYVIIKKLN